MSPCPYLLKLPFYSNFNFKTIHIFTVLLVRTSDCEILVTWFEHLLIEHEYTAAAHNDTARSRSTRAQMSECVSQALVNTGHTHTQQMFTTDEYAH